MTTTTGAHVHVKDPTGQMEVWSYADGEQDDSEVTA